MINESQSPPKTVEEWKTFVLEYCKKDYVTFAELVRRFEGASGEYSMMSGAYPNIVYWTGLSEELTQALLELRREEKIHFVPSQVLVYLVDGMVPSLPVVTAKGAKRGYKKPHWLPTCIRLGPDKEPIST